ncbi:hypothetical protein CHS0354_016661 [Potamilus streckersoni]|uniref:Uncharacterized protein n=1 Tax=Potamilus streckersoni TaxID=2493646 RepID=A0AAE0WEB9_9BIVA|nr:hypothetical protein CHS0354_016661 [Potamilus streckersoni]
MDISTVCKSSPDLKSYLFTSVSSKEKYEASLSSYSRGECLVPVSNAEYGMLNLDLEEDPLFLDYTANVITPRFTKRRRLTLIKLYSSESVNPGDRYGCYTSSILDQYLEKSVPIRSKTNSERSVEDQSLPDCGTDLKDIKPLSCIQMDAEHRLSVSFDTDYSSISSGEDSVKNAVFRPFKVKGRESTLIPLPQRKKMIIKCSENNAKGKKRKNNDDKKPNRSEDGQDIFKTGKSSYPIPPPRKKARHRTKDQNRASEDGDHQSSSNGIIFSAYPEDVCGSIKRYEIPIKENYTCINTTCVKNFDVCERKQSERSTVSGSELSLNSNLLQRYHSRYNVRTKRPVMGKSAIFMSIDLLSFDVLAEINRKVHLKYGDSKRRRIKTNGILKSESGAKKTIRETSEVFRKIGPCRKLIAIKNLFMKKDCSSIPCV